MGRLAVRGDGIMVYDPDMCERGERICLACGATVCDTDNYCWDCGARLLTPEEAETENPLLYMEYQRWEGDR